MSGKGLQEQSFSFNLEDIGEEDAIAVTVEMILQDNSAKEHELLKNAEKQAGSFGDFKLRFLNILVDNRNLEFLRDELNAKREAK